MAIMIPDVIPFPDARSKEPELFDQLKENLPDEYYVFHSLKFYCDKAEYKRDYEADFVILHPMYGLMCIECKSSYGGCINGECMYQNGTPMSDPYNQARTNKYALKQLLQDRIDSDQSKALAPLKGRGRLFGVYDAVWFGITKQHFKAAKMNYPLNGAAGKTLFFDETASPETAAKRIEELFKYCRAQDKDVRTGAFLSKDMTRALIGRILCPVFQLAVLPPSEKSSGRFTRLLRDQMTVLDFLEDQNVTVINGPAGSGKTFIAVEKARRLGANGDKVLFLCFNRLLKEHLETTYTSDNGYDNIVFDTIGNFTVSHASFNDYAGLYHWLVQDADFEYKHIIIDEGQDFAQIEESLKKDKSLKNASILDAFNALVSIQDGCFYLFYDKSQLIQGFGHLPEFINKAECKITLKRNCRNTLEITECLEKAVPIRYKDKDRQPVSHTQPVIFFENNQAAARSRLKNLISRYKSLVSHPEDIVILSMKSAKDLDSPDKSCLGNAIVNGSFENVRVYTFRQFKGLEAECIIIVDLDYNYIKASRHKDFLKSLYVATSRARSYLYAISDLSQAQCFELLSAGEPENHDVQIDGAFESFAKTIGFVTGLK